MKAKEDIKRFREMGAADLKQTISSAREELMNFRFRKASGQLPNSASVQTLRRQVARAETILKETELKASSSKGSTK